jgi:signal transduction histidine kinase
MGISLPTRELYLLTGLLFAYNAVLYLLLRYWISMAVDPTGTKVGQVITLQISADLFILSTIIHYSGGIENPFCFFFVFHMIITSILRSRLQSYVQATLAVLLFGGFTLLESEGTIAHYPLEGFAGHNLYKDQTFVLGYLFVFAVTLYLVVYMTTSIVEQLRFQQDELERANKRLEEKDKINHKYVLRVTHDIKGHLAAIEGCLHPVFDQMIGPLNEKQKDLTGRAYRRTGKCMNFVTALLKVTHMKLTGTLDISDLSLRTCIGNALAAVHNRAEEKTITVSCHFDIHDDHVNGEPVLIEETMTNLLFNAVKYTPAGGTVKIDISEQEGDFLIEVSDTGIGIPSEAADHIFEEFYRAPNARDTEREGTGLGLSFAKQVIERHGGRIWAKNRPEGGCIVGFMLPRDRKR